MITIRKSAARGKTQSNWLKSFHTFSFAEYHDPHFMHVGDLRVINEDTIEAGQGFGTHPHRDMDIITYVVKGSLEHKDSMGNGSIIRPGEIQRMSAGTGITHSEFNHSNTELLHLLQIWIIPNQLNLIPSYEQKTIPKISNQFILIGSKEGLADAVTIHQDVNLYAAYLNKDAMIDYAFKKDRIGWLQLVSGNISLNGQILSAGDGAEISSEQKIQLQCNQEAELLFFDLGQ